MHLCGPCLINRFDLLTINLAPHEHIYDLMCRSTLMQRAQHGPLCRYKCEFPGHCCALRCHHDSWWPGSDCRGQTRLYASRRRPKTFPLWQTALALPAEWRPPLPSVNFSIRRGSTDPGSVWSLSVAHGTSGTSSSFGTHTALLGDIWKAPLLDRLGSRLNMGPWMLFRWATVYCRLVS